MPKLEKYYAIQSDRSADGTVTAEAIAKAKVFRSHINGHDLFVHWPGVKPLLLQKDPREVEWVSTELI